MNDATRETRHSQALEAKVVADPQARADIEARNGLGQYDLAVRFVFDALERGNFRLRPSTMLSLHREALQGLSSYAGNFRPGAVEIIGSQHQPIGAHLVAAAVEDLCDYVNDRWRGANAIHLAAYVMWRLNWIHPFADGNGRTSRATSFVVLSARLGVVLPGTPTYPELIIHHRSAYEDALDAADSAWKEQRVDVSKMEALLESLLAEQLARVFELAGGRA